MFDESFFLLKHQDYWGASLRFPEMAHEGAQVSYRCANRALDQYDQKGAPKPTVVEKNRTELILDLENKNIFTRGPLFCFFQCFQPLFKV